MVLTCHQIPKVCLSTIVACLQSWTTLLTTSNIIFGEQVLAVQFTVHILCYWQFFLIFFCLKCLFSSLMLAGTNKISFVSLYIIWPLHDWMKMCLFSCFLVVFCRGIDHWSLFLFALLDANQPFLSGRLSGSFRRRLPLT